MLFFHLDHRQAAKGERYRKQRQLPKNRSQFCPLKTESKKKRTPTFANGSPTNRKFRDLSNRK